MKKILMRGCVGLFGVNFTKHLLSKKYQVVGVDNFFGEYEKFVEIQHEVQNTYCNHDKSKIELSFNDYTDIKTLIEKMLVWLISQPIQDVKKMDYEVTKNIYNFN
jgi:GDP-D-mannose dehydratase